MTSFSSSLSLHLEHTLRFVRLIFRGSLRFLGPFFTPKLEDPHHPIALLFEALPLKQMQFKNETYGPFGFQFDIRMIFDFKQL